MCSNFELQTTIPLIREIYYRFAWAWVVFLQAFQELGALDLRFLTEAQNLTFQKHKVSRSRACVKLPSLRFQFTVKIGHDCEFSNISIPTNCFQQWQHLITKIHKKFNMSKFSSPKILLENCFPWTLHQLPVWEIITNFLDHECSSKLYKELGFFDLTELWMKHNKLEFPKHKL